jgi:sirohydrochlorin cobaltochelatase
MLSAYLLVSHGSRDPRPGIAMQQIAKMVSTKIGIPPQNAKNLIGTAYLELQPEPLHVQICEFANQILQGRGQVLPPVHFVPATAVDFSELCSVRSRDTLNRTGVGEREAGGQGDKGTKEKGSIGEVLVNLKILPLFLLSGVHVMEEIPLEVELAQKILGEKIKIDLLPYLGTHPDFGKLFTQPETQGDATILMAHGSRRPGFSKDIEIVASSLNATTCYWAVPPNLETTIQQLVAAGKHHITIIPYFLFAGGITDAIASQLEALKLQFPGISLHLAEPLGASEDLANLIWDLLQQ